jgi:hypothetical protein
MLHLLTVGFGLHLATDGKDTLYVLTILDPQIPAISRSLLLVCMLRHSTPDGLLLCTLKDLYTIPFLVVESASAVVTRVLIASRKVLTGLTWSEGAEGLLYQQVHLSL